MILRIVAPTPGVKGKGSKSSPLSPAGGDTTDVVKRSEGISSVIREDDRALPLQEL